MLTKLRPQIQPILKIVAKPVMGLSPNIISWIGLTFPIVFYCALYFDAPLVALFALCLTPFDALDGYVAKQTGKVTKYGELLDASLDRVSDSVIITAFAAASLVSWPIVVVVVTTNLLISYVRAKAELASKATFKMEEGLIERPDRLVVLGIALILHMLFPFNVIGEHTPTEIVFYILAILSSITILQRIKLAKKLLQK